MKTRIKFPSRAWRSATINAFTKTRGDRSPRVALTFTQYDNVLPVFIELTQSNALELADTLVDCAEQLENRHE